MTKSFIDPELQRDIAGFTYNWPTFGLTIELQRLNDEGKGEIAFYHKNGNGNELLRYSKVNLLDNRGITTLVKSLQTEDNPDIDWLRVMTYVTAKTIQLLRDGINVVNINEEPQTKQVLWCLYPFLPLNEPTTIFGPGGKGKSVLADLFALIVHCGIRISGLSYLHAPQRINVLYLDWERDEQVHRQRITAIKNAQGITDNNQIHYIKCNHPITAMVDALCKKVADLNIGLIIIDSQMAATAGMGGVKTDAEVSSEYYNCLRRFNCTSLTIDHTTKAGASSDNDDGGPFGSVVKYNRATSVYRIESDQESDSDIVEIKLKHTKFNLGRKQSERGIRIEFNNNDSELSGLSFSEFNLSENEKFKRSLPEWQIVRGILEASGPMACRNIADLMNEDNPDKKYDAKRISDLMTKKRNPPVFVKVEGTDKWGLLGNVF